MRPLVVHRKLRILGFLSLGVLLSCSGRQLRIDSIRPAIGDPGSLLEIRGTGFGDQRGESVVRIAGEAPTASSYLEWGDDRISVRIPDFSDSGLVYVEVRGRKSNPSLFTVKSAVPKLATAAEDGIAPRVTSLSRTSGPIGSVVVIQGRNFGSSRMDSKVLFGWQAEAAPSGSSGAAAPASVDASDFDFCYDSWSDREIAVRVPDGAISGNLIVSTASGSSEPLFFDVTDRPGAKVYKDKRTYVISYSVNIDGIKASGENELYLWTPRPLVSSYQRDTRLLSRSEDPFVEDHLGSSLYRLSDLKTGQTKTLAFSYIVETYAVETSVKQSAIKKQSDAPAYVAYTGSSPIVPSDAPELRKEATLIIGKERNPYAQARRIYDFLTKSLEYGEAGEPANGDYVLSALESKKADAYSASLLFCSLARASGIPAVPVSGFVIDRNRVAAPHWWAEFWIEGFGWIPVDPAAGAGAAPVELPARDDPRNYYFGNLDSHRVVFSRDFANLSAMDPRGRTVQRPHSYSLQALWEEAVGKLDAYSSLWSDLTVTGVY